MRYWDKKIKGKYIVKKNRTIEKTKMITKQEFSTSFSP